MFILEVTGIPLQRRSYHIIAMSPIFGGTMIETKMRLTLQTVRRLDVVWPYGKATTDDNAIGQLDVTLSGY